jgi:hypothetical protein
MGELLAVEHELGFWDGVCVFGSSSPCFKILFKNKFVGVVIKELKKSN